MASRILGRDNHVIRTGRHGRRTVVATGPLHGSAWVMPAPARLPCSRPSLAQVGPETGRDLHREQRQVLVELGGGSRAGDDRADHRMGERELQRGGRQRHVVRLADGGDLLHPRNDLRRGGGVVPGVTTGQDAGVQRAADDDRGAARLAQRQQVVERCLFQQRVAAGEQKGVPVAERREPRSAPPSR